MSARIAELRGPVLTLDSVSVHFSGRAVLDRVSFAVQPGEFTALIGQNGAGKTTLLRVILGLQHPSSGSVRVGRAGAVGYVPQKVMLDPDMPLRARDVVALGLDGHRLGAPLGPRAAARRRQRVDAALEAVDARQFADSRVGALSGGEQQRVLIAHALIGEPKLLLLDEPLANLDLRSQYEVVALLADVARSRGVAVVMSAHDMNPLLPVMQRIVYLAGGRAVGGTVEEVVRSEVLSALYGHHVDVLRVHGRILVVAGEEGAPGPGPGEEEGPVEQGIISVP